eukprot:4375319-Pleurochrysis_carterae.AAC.3
MVGKQADAFSQRVGFAFKAQGVGRYAKEGTNERRGQRVQQRPERSAAVARRWRQREATGEASSSSRWKSNMDIP